MSWTCPHQLKDLFCDLRKKECKPGDEGCVLKQQFNFVDVDADVDSSIKDEGAPLTTDNTDDTD